MSKNEITISLENMDAAEIYSILQAIESANGGSNDAAVDTICDFLGANATRLLAEALMQGRTEAAATLHDLYDDMTPGWDSAVQSVFDWREHALVYYPQQDWALQEAANEANKHGNVYARGRFAGMAELAAQAIEADGPDEAEEIIKAFHEVYEVAYVEM